MDLGPVHPDDDMFAKSKSGEKEYDAVGRHAITVINLALTDPASVTSVLDFACGHGRVARKLASEFPKAHRSFSDIKEGAWRFCAENFGHDGFSSTPDFSDLEIPRQYDLIWVGSLFTHLEWHPSVELVDKLLGALTSGGTLVATFRGNTQYKKMRDPAETARTGGYYEQMLVDYEEDGFGYMEYKNVPGVGQNLFKPEKIRALSSRADIERFQILDQTWAGAHDVAVWERS